MAISIYALDLPESRAKLKAADIILGVDVMTRKRLVMYGRQVLERIVADTKADGLVVVEVELDERTNEPEWLAAAVTAWKGSCDFQSPERLRRRLPRAKKMKKPHQ